MTFLKALRTLVASVVLAAAILLVYIVSTGTPVPFLNLAESVDTPATSAQAAATRLADYDWAKVSEISEKIKAAESDGEAVKIAKQYGLVDADGNLSSDEISVSCKDGASFHVRLAGIRADECADGSGKAGLTFVTSDAVAMRAMNENGDNAGGWKDSQMRSWLNSDEKNNLPDELAGSIVKVRKATNNPGSARDASAVTTTDDDLWLLSVREVCGDIDWFSHEYGADFAWLDSVANAEGSQYQLFSAAGVGPREPGNGALVRNFDGKAVSWSYRTPFYFVYENLDARFFYNVMETGYPYSSTAPDVKQGVVFGFCV